MWMALADIASDLNLSASFQGDESMVIVNGSFLGTLETSQRLVQYLTFKGYTQSGLERSTNSQGAVFTDDAQRSLGVTIRWGNEVHVERKRR